MNLNLNLNLKPQGCAQTLTGAVKTPGRNDAKRRARKCKSISTPTSACKTPSAPLNRDDGGQGRKQ